MKNKHNIVECENKIENLKNKPKFREDLIEGRNAVIEALKSNNVTIEQILISDGNMSGSINTIFAIAKEKHVVVKKVDKRKLDKISQTGVHQGIIAHVTPYKYCELEDILDYALKRREAPFIIILDEIEDPHNFGAIIRTAEVCGAHGIIIPKRKNVGITPTVYKSSAGAVDYMRICKVTNLNTVIEKLKKQNIWVYGADMTGESYCFDVDFNSSIALIIGSEGRGISKLTKQKCDKLVKIPMIGNISSLNVSVASGILMYEILKQKIKSDKN
ncbi:23S rRNA (guanosine(2251)-2'-O)-methyltransferase RlmB [Clostridium sp. BJN0013]|uniref:23S rRNA (guanosine(2251)-2'-O)-methyltransferase RlmB n=1 Tax=Clostridium sp. BJN0013 TaxID=3236840 RepID=UPI0034C6A2B4